ALRHDFPEAVIETGQFGQDPNRPFAARCFDVLHADEAFIRQTLSQGERRKLQLIYVSSIHASQISSVLVA
ncbi:hypothetical protein R5H32_20770, partial [Defluviimonas sp. D31]|uniref:hypothetical protein n=1 Tax=Defluviimonas sp. D31 TaxID=3083253 RepID=UPI00296EA684